MRKKTGVFVASAIGAIALAGAHAHAAFNVVECLATHTKAECSRQMMIEVENSKPLTADEDVFATSGKFAVTIQGEGWLKRGWGSHPDQAKDLGLIKDSSLGMLTIETSDVKADDVDDKLTKELNELFDGLDKGFKKGNIEISLKTKMELLPLTFPGGAGTLGRFCYHIDITNGKTLCVYRGYLHSSDDDAYVLLGTIGDFDGMRAELEGIITSLKFMKDPHPKAQ